jgi:hypothetical protein
MRLQIQWGTLCLGAAIILLISGCAATPGYQTCGEIAGGNFWKGDVFLRGDMIVPAGETLTIAPGTRVQFLPPARGEDSFTDHPFFPGSELIVYGRVVAEGTSENPIIFKAEDSQGPPGSWGAINFQEDSSGRFSHCILTQADSALHSQNASMRVENCFFSQNLVAIRFNQTDILIRNNLIADNQTGIRFHYGAPEIVDNIFSGNEKGIFVTSFPKDYRICGNTIIGSRRYHVVLGEEVPDDVHMRNNYWGSDDSDEIEAGMFDGRRVEYIGRVLFEPFLTSPNPVAGPTWNR